MPTFDSDGVQIFYQSTGEGFPLIWSHEFAGSYESWSNRRATSAIATASSPTTTAATRPPTCPPTRRRTHKTLPSKTCVA